MTSQLKDIGNQVAQQTRALSDQLDGLYRLLETQEEMLSQLKAYFWGAAFLGLAAPVIIGGGALFAAGLVSAIVLGTKIAELTAQMGETLGRIDAVRSAIDSLSKVSLMYDELEGMYADMNAFWQRLYQYSQDLRTDDADLLHNLGNQTLPYTFEMKAAKAQAAQLADATQLYIDTPGREGIKLPHDPALQATAGRPPGAHGCERAESAAVHGRRGRRGGQPPVSRYGRRGRCAGWPPGGPSRSRPRRTPGMTRRS